MRVVVTLSGTDAGRSGLGSYVLSVLPLLAARLAARGGRLVAAGTRRDLAAYAASLAEAELHRLPDWVDQPGAGALWHLTRFAAYGRARAGDVVLLPAANRRLSLAAGIPSVAVVHDLAPLLVRGKYDAARTAYLRYGVLAGLRRASRLVAVSRATRDDLASALGQPEAPIAVIHNGVDTRRFRPDPGARERAAAAPYVLYVARLEHPGKNHARLVSAFAGSAIARTHRLVLAGDDWGGRAEIARRAAAHGIAHLVDLPGRVSDEALPGLVAGADLVTMVGLHEGFGLPVLEALACGRPIVAARAGSLPEVGGPLAVLCDPLDPGDMAAALDRAAADTDLRARVEREGPAWAARFSWESAAEALATTCEEALAA